MEGITVIDSMHEDRKTPHAANSPDYWQQHGLDQPPFDDTSHYAMYYPPAQWRKHLQRLQKLPRSNESLVTITGMLGIGKTMFIAQLLSHIDNLPTALIKGSSGVTTDNLLKAMCTQFCLPRSARQHTDNHPFSPLLKTLQETQKKYFVVIDDAHRLPIETLAAIVDMAVQQHNGSAHLHFILLGENQIKSRIDALISSNTNTPQTIYLTLDPLSRDETKNYLKHRLNRAGLTGKSPFSENIITRIHRLSGGIPGRINRVAQQALMNTLVDEHPPLQAQPSMQQSASNTHFFQRHQVRIASLALLSALLIGGFAAQSNLQNTLYHLSWKQPGLPLHTTPVSVTTPSPILANAITPSVTQQKTPATPPALLAAAPKPHATTTPDEEKLMALNGYTLQLTGARNPQQVKQLTERNHLTNTTLTYHTHYLNKDWHVLVYGNYATPSQARNALHHLPANLQKLHPWIRPMKTVHASIRTRQLT